MCEGVTWVCVGVRVSERVCGSQCVCRGGGCVRESESVCVGVCVGYMVAMRGLEVCGVMQCVCW